MENLRWPMVNGASSCLKIYTSSVRVYGIELEESPVRYE